MKKLIIILLCSCSTILVAQNLVPNPSFETYVTCPISDSEVQQGIITPWTTASTATSDYFNACFIPSPFPSMDVPSNAQGYQFARTGDGYAGIISAETADTALTIIGDYREYLQVPLTAPLVAGNEYNIEFFWSLSDRSSLYAEEIGIYFSTTPININQSTTLPYTPQLEQSGSPLNDTTNWVPFQQTYTAVGGEMYITIGNFSNVSNSIWGTTGTACDFYQTFGCFAYYYIDDVSVVAKPVGVNELTAASISIHPNPTLGQTTLSLKEASSGVLNIRNYLGQEVLKVSFNNTKQFDINLAGPAGLYFIQLDIDGQLITKKVIKE